MLVKTGGDGQHLIYLLGPPPIIPYTPPPFLHPSFICLCLPISHLLSSLFTHLQSKEKYENSVI